MTAHLAQPWSERERKREREREREREKDYFQSLLFSRPFCPRNEQEPWKKFAFTSTLALLSKGQLRPLQRKVRVTHIHKAETER